MSGLESATTRLRQTFHYPTEDEHSQGSRDELDEEEQESLLSSLQSQSTISNKTYILIFTILPITLTPLFGYYLFVSSSSPSSPNTPVRVRLLCLLALTSLLTSAFTMFFLSDATVDTTDARSRLDARQRQVGRGTFVSAPPHAGPLISLFTKILDKADDMRLDLDREGPLLVALPVLNWVICGLLALVGVILLGREGKGGDEFLWAYLLLPGVMAGMTTIARRSIVDEQKEIGVLKGLRYGYKGA